MKKYKIYFAVKSSFEFEIEATHEILAQNELNRKSQLIEDAIKSVAKTEGLTVCDIWGGEDDEVKDLEIENLPEAATATKTVTECIFITCPHCGSESEYNDEAEEFSQIQNDFDEKDFSVITCEDCGKVYKVSYIKKY